MQRSTLSMCVGMLLVAFVASPGHGDAIVFLSPVTTIGGGAVLGNPIKVVTLGEEFSLGVWVSAPVGLTVNGLALDIVETAGILDANTTGDPNLNMAVQDAGINFDRWDSITPPQMDVSSIELFVGSNTVGVDPGVALSGSAFIRGGDANYDPAVGAHGAFLHAIITMKSNALGTTYLFFRVGEKKIGYSPDTDPNINFGTGDDEISREIEGNMSSLADATIEVIPEPTTLGLLAVGALGALVRRRRRGMS